MEVLLWTSERSGCYQLPNLRVEKGFHFEEGSNKVKPINCVYRIRAIEGLLMKTIAIANQKSGVGKTEMNSHGAEDYLALCKEIVERG